jgi:ribonuclease HI
MPLNNTATGQGMNFSPADLGRAATSTRAAQHAAQDDTLQNLDIPRPGNATATTCTNMGHQDLANREGSTTTHWVNRDQAPNTSAVSGAFLGMNLLFAGQTTAAVVSYPAASTGLIPGITCYTDASIAPDAPGQPTRKAGIGILIVNKQVQPVLTMHIKAIMQEASSVLMAEAAALALAASIASNLNYTNVSFLTDSIHLVQFLSSTDHNHPPDWRMKTYTQQYDNCAATIQSTLHKINRAENVIADSQARQAFSVVETLHQPCHMQCSYGAHLSQCPLLQALSSVTMNCVWLLAAYCC